MFVSISVYVFWVIRSKVRGEFVRFSDPGHELFRGGNESHPSRSAKRILGFFLLKLVVSWQEKDKGFGTGTFAIGIGRDFSMASGCLYKPFVLEIRAIGSKVNFS